jgi:hypothetical protein
VIKDENMEKIPSRPTVFLYLSYPFPYLQKNMEMGRKEGRNVSRLYLRDPVFIRNDSVLVPYL